MAHSSLKEKQAKGRDWYHKNKDKVLQYKRRARQLRIKYIQKLKDVPCKDCGVRYPHYVMDFDHVLVGSKKETVNRLAGERAGWLTLKQEIEKCEVVCVNCHRVRTHKRRTHVS